MCSSDLCCCVPLTTNIVQIHLSHFVLVMLCLLTVYWQLKVMTLTSHSNQTHWFLFCQSAHSVCQSVFTRVHACVYMRECMCVCVCACKFCTWRIAFICLFWYRYGCKCVSVCLCSVVCVEMLLSNVIFHGSAKYYSCCTLLSQYYTLYLHTVYYRWIYVYCCCWCTLCITVLCFTLLFMCMIFTVSCNVCMPFDGSGL